MNSSELLQNSSRTSQDLMLAAAGSNRGVFDVSISQDELTFTDLWRAVQRRRAIVAGTLLLFVVAAVAICAFSKRRYSATAEIQVQKEQSAPLGLEGPVGGADASYSDSLQDNITLQTQANILQSASLELRVVHDLNLTSTDDFKPTFSPVGWVLGLISPNAPSEAQLGPPTPEDMGLSPRERMHVLTVFDKNLKVKPVSGTRLIDVSYLSTSPHLAAAIVNHLVDALSEYNFETRHAATARTANFLTGQLADLRKQSEELQAQLARAQRESGVISLGGVDAQGREQVYSAVLDKLQQAITAYTQAQSNRIAKDAIYQAARSGDPEAVSSLNGAGFTSPSDSELTLLQNLRLEKSTEEAKLAEASSKFGPAYPKLAEMRQNVEALNTSIAAAVARLAERAKNDAYVAQEVENHTRQAFLDLKAQADALTNKTIDYTILRQEADQSRTLYEALFKQLKEAGVLADFKVSNISLVDPARVPARPAKPNVVLYLAASIVSGLFFGCCAAVVRDRADNKIRSVLEVETQLGQLPFGVLPLYRQSRRVREAVRSRIREAEAQPLALLTDSIAVEPAYGVKRPSIATPSTEIVALADGQSPYIEALRALRTSVLLSRVGAAPKVILVASSVSGEGKTMLSVNLATLLAQQAKKVLLVDCDLRCPMLHRIWNLPNTEGLSYFLAGGAANQDPKDFGIAIESVPGLTVLTAGPVPPYPAELLGSESMAAAIARWREKYDFVLFDGSPILPVTDSVILNALADVTLLVARHELTERQSLDRSYRILQASGPRSTIGIVLNAVQADSSTYYHYYGYKNGAYYGSKEDAKKSA